MEMAVQYRILLTQWREQTKHKDGEVNRTRREENQRTEEMKDTDGGLAGTNRGHSSHPHETVVM